MQSTNQQQQPKPQQPEIITRTTYSDGHQVIVFEQKQQPLRIGGFEI